MCGKRPSRGRFGGAELMDNEQQPGRPKVPTIKRARRLVSRTRVIMILLLLVAIPVFIALANKTVHENAEAIRQTFGQ
jgi:hypothetical protein